MHCMWQQDKFPQLSWSDQLLIIEWGSLTKCKAFWLSDQKYVLWNYTPVLINRTPLIRNSSPEWPERNNISNIRNGANDMQKLRTHASDMLNAQNRETWCCYCRYCTSHPVTGNQWRIWSGLDGRPDWPLSPGKGKIEEHPCPLIPFPFLTLFPFLPISFHLGLLPWHTRTMSDITFLQKNFSFKLKF